MPRPKQILVADIGGTNSRFALALGETLLESSVKIYSNSGAKCLPELIESYLAGQNVEAACIAAAGPLENGAIQLTNHPWRVDPKELPFAKTFLINDLQAMAHALPAPSATPAPRMVLNIGTGLNTAILPSTGLAPASEAGYMHLPLLTEAENAVLARCAEAFGAPVAEAVLSAPSLAQLNRVLTGATATPAAITANWPAPTLSLYLKVLGAYAGDLALALLPLGGIWLAGSLGRRLLPHLAALEFRGTFESRGAYTSLMQRFRFHVLEDEFAALRGAARYSAQAQSARA